MKILVSNAFLYEDSCFQGVFVLKILVSKAHLMNILVSKALLMKILVSNAFLL